MPPPAKKRAVRGQPARLASESTCASRESQWPRHAGNHTFADLALLAMAGVVAGMGALIANWAVRRFGVSPNVAGSVAFCAAWIALYPWMRLHQQASRWRHWARGAFILIVLWFVIMLSG